MAAQLHYRLIQISRLGGTVPQMIGSFVVGIPISALEEYGKYCPESGDEEAIQNLISHSEHQKMLELLRIPSATSTLETVSDFSGDPESLGTATFEGTEEKKFWFIR